MMGRSIWTQPLCPTPLFQSLSLRCQAMARHCPPDSTVTPQVTHHLMMEVMPLLAMMGLVTWVHLGHTPRAGLMADMKTQHVLTDLIIQAQAGLKVDRLIMRGLMAPPLIWPMDQ